MTAGRVSDEHERTGLAGSCQQGVQVLGSAHSVLRVLGVFAPALSGAVVGADPGGGADGAGDPGPGGGDLPQAVGEHDGGAAVSAAVQVQPVTIDLVALAGGGVGALIAVLRDVLVGGTEGRESQDGHDGDEHPASGASHSATELDEHPHGQSQYGRWPDPAQPRQGVIPGGEQQEGDSGAAHEDRRNDGPMLRPGGVAAGEGRDQRPAGPEAGEHRAGDDTLGAASEHHQRKHQRCCGTRYEGPGDDSSHRS